MTELQPPVCCDCKHFAAPDGTAICALIRDIVYGHPMQMTCSAARGSELRCGVKGRYFEAKA